MIVCLSFCAAVDAHEGPPFPVLVDEPIPGYLVSVWADPDIGTGTFYVLTEPRDSASNVPAPRVEVWIQPTSGRLAKATYPAERQDLRNRLQFLAEPEFDRQEMWKVGIVVHAPNDQTHELTTEVEATPPGVGAWGLLIYLFPFVLFGGLWGIGLLRHWRASAAHASPRSGSRISPINKPETHPVEAE
jgi:hypothetical protein